jgi:hypothetical protein
MKIHDKIRREPATVATDEVSHDVTSTALFKKRYRVVPSTSKFIRVQYEHKRFITRLLSHYPNASIYFEETSLGAEWHETVCFDLGIPEGVFLCMDKIYSTPNGAYHDKSGKKLKNTQNVSVVSTMNIIYSPKAKRDVKRITTIFSNCSVGTAQQRGPSAPVIHTVFSGNDGPYIQSFENPNILSTDLLDLHYGTGASDFHALLLDHLQQRDKGLVVFYGDSGTGKSSYIQQIICDVYERGIPKPVLVVPPHMIDALFDPSYISFLTQWAAQYHEGIIMIVEDATDYLLRNRGGSLVNLMSLTDGFLNSMYGAQVIITLDMEYKEIDPVLLRPSRLICHKKFRKLEIGSAKALAEKLEIDPEIITGPMTLAEFYARIEGTEPFSHDGNDNHITMGFGN